MSKTTTVPSAAFARLGELRLDDPAVVVTDGESIWCEHPLSCAEGLYDHDLADRVLVEQSKGALLRVLARHLGWDGAGQLELDIWNVDECWYLCAVDIRRQFMRRRWQAHLPAHISTTLDYTAALAAAVVWYARLERVRAGSDATVVLGPDPSADLAAIEESFGLPEWRVEVAS